jgi:hypothetical protein
MPGMSGRHIRSRAVASTRPPDQSRADDDYVCRKPVNDSQLEALAWRFVTETLFADSPDAALIDAAAQSADLWPRVVILADHHLVTPALWPSLKAAAVDSRVPEEAAQYFRALYDMNVERNLRLLRQLDRVLAAFGERAIAPMLLKGAAYLKLDAHGDIGARILSDIDLLVPPQGLRLARQTLHELGYRPMEGQTSRTHHDVPLARSGEPAAIELHWAILGDRASGVFPDQAYWQRAKQMSADGCTYSVLCPNDLMIHSFAHSQILDRHADTFRIALRAIQDFKALCVRYAEELDWGALMATARTRGFEAEWRSYLYTAFRLTGMRPGVSVRFGLREKLSHSLSRAAARWDSLAVGLEYLAELSKRDIQSLYGGDAGPMATNMHRLSHMLRRLDRKLKTRDYDNEPEND